jgi:hypothetical protein
VPYARRSPGDTDADTTGTYPANVGTAARTAAPVRRSPGEMPIRCSSNRAASMVV